MIDLSQILKLDDDDDAILITFAGNLIKGVTHSANALQENADAAQGLMITMMKNPKVHRGFWHWKIRDKWSTVRGSPLKKKGGKWVL